MPQIKTRNTETKRVFDELSSGRQRTQLVNSTFTEIGTVANPIQVDIVDATGITITVDTEFPAAAAITDNFANPTTTSVMSMLMGYDGATWDRLLVGAGTEAAALRVTLPTNGTGVVGLATGNNLIGLVQPFAGVIEGGLTELIGINEQVAQNQYGGSVSVALAAGPISGEILNIMVVQTEDDAGAILAQSGVLFIYDADPTIAVGDTTMLAADGPTIIGKVDITSGDWVTDTNTGVVYLTTAIGFHSLSSLFFAYKHTGATTVNSGATDDEQFRFNFWYRRDS